MPRWRMPAEWAPHERCLMAWPTRQKLWRPYFEQAKAEYAAVANAIAEFEPVLMVANTGQGAEARAACTASVEVLELPIDDSWLRDSGPLIVVDDDGGRAGVDFRFNSWGEKYLPYDRDERVSGLLLEHLGVERIGVDMVLEGGSITVDGEGTLITTEQCLLNKNRNPGLSREQITANLERSLGVSKVIWLPYGHFGDHDTDGHVDGVCTFAAPGLVVTQTCDDPTLPDYERMAANQAVLDATTDAAGRPIRVIGIPQFPFHDLPDGTTTMVAYANFYVANGGVVVPISGHPDCDEPALAAIAEAFPAHRVVGVPGNVIAFGGGGVHCVTQQVPLAVRAGSAAQPVAAEALGVAS